MYRYEIYPTMKNCIKLFLLLCSMLAISALSAANVSDRNNNEHFETVITEPFVPFIDLLREGESYQIELVSLGCFNGSKQTLEIFREIDGYAVQFGDTIKELGTFEINAIRDFELNLQALTLGGCSTVDTYTLAYGAAIVKVTDGTCSFNGGRELMKQLGLLTGK